MVSLAKWIIIFLTVLTLVLGFFGWKRGYFEAPPPPDPTPIERKAQVKKTADYCASLAWGDGATDVERLAAAVAHINLAKANKSTTCDEWERFGTLIGKDSWTLFPWRRFQSAEYQLTQASEANRAAYNQTVLDLSDYQTDPTGWLKKYPWLACLTHMIRVTWPGATPHQDHSLEKKMKLVFTSPTGAKFFCPKDP